MRSIVANGISLQILRDVCSMRSASCVDRSSDGKRYLDCAMVSPTVMVTALMGLEWSVFLEHLYCVDEKVLLPMLSFSLAQSMPLPLRDALVTPRSCDPRISFYSKVVLQAFL